MLPVDCCTHSPTSLIQTELFLVGANKLTGTIPSIGAKSLQFFDARLNLLTGTIPSSIFDSPDSLQFVYLQNNKLSGTVPANFAAASNLVDLYLSFNALTGIIPEVPTGSLLFLEELLFDNNKFAGSMPASVCALRNASLQDLWADCAPPATLDCSLSDCCTECFPLPVRP
jgi:hypothetical protein